VPPLVNILDKLQLYALQFDESFGSLQRQGSPINLAQWYSQAEVSILHLTPLCGDEVALVDSKAKVRVFSFVTLQFRWASPAYLMRLAPH
jgi:hypothetical protein